MNKGFCSGESTPKTVQRIHVANVNYIPWSKAPRVKLGISNKLGRKLGTTEALLDYGADLSIADLSFMKQIGSNKKMLRAPIDTEVRGATQDTFTKIGRITVMISFGSNVVEDTIIVVKEKITVPLLVRWDVSAKLRNDVHYPAALNQVISEKQSMPEYLKTLPEDPNEMQLEEVKQRIMEVFRDVFTDGQSMLKPMGCKPSEIQLVPEANPIRISTARKLAYAFREETKQELDKMVQQGIIQPVGDKSTDWCHPMVVVEKPGGGIRICVDLTKLNKYVKRPTHPGPSPQEVVSDIPPNQKFFTTLDAIKGYWQIPLTKESQPPTTFITPWGRYKFLRAPMGLSSTGDKYNLLMDAAFDGLHNVKKIVDDILQYWKECNDWN